MDVSFRGVVMRLWLVVALLLPATAHADARSDIDHLLRRFAVGFANGNLDGFAGRNSSDSFLRDHAALTRVRCLELLGVTVDEITIHGNHTNAALSLLLRETERSGSGVEMSLRHLVVTLSRQKLVWHIIRCEPAEAALARDVEPVGAARLSLLSLNVELITPQLDRIIYQDGLAQTNQGHFEEAKRLADLAMDIARQVGDRAGESLALGVNGIVKRDAGETQEGVALSREALTIAEESGEPDVIARALINLGRAIEEDDRVSAEPQSLYRRVADMEGHLIERSLAVRALHNIGADLVKRLTDLQAARPYYERAIRLSKELGDRLGETSAEVGLAATYETDQDCGPAVMHLRRAVQLAPPGEFKYDALGMLAQCYMKAGDLLNAERLLKTAMSGFNSPAVRERKFALLNIAAELHEKQHRSTLALDEARQGYEGLMAMGWTGGMTLPQLLIKRRRYSDAIRVIEKGLPIAR